MNKKVIGIIITILLICIVAATVFFTMNNKNSTSKENNKNTESNNEQQNNSNNTNEGNKKILVVYFSATNNTKNVALKIADNLNADLFEIVPKEEYTLADLDYTDKNSRVSKEHDNEKLRDIELSTTKVNNWDTYDTVLIGYPIWWGIAAWPVNNFVKDNDFTGKTVIPFCTSASSSMGNSGKLLEDLTKTGNWKDGQRFSSSASNSDIKSFTDSIK